MNQITVKRLFPAILVVATIYGASMVLATQPVTPALKTAPGRIVDIPVMIDQAENLAGIKMTIRYDIKFLKFIEAVKTKKTSNFMHIVNEKKPGLLIVVMAGAGGIKGKDFPLLSLQFEITKGLKSNHTTKINITEIQLMSDKLKDIKSNIRIDPVTILPATVAREVKKAPAL